MHPITQQTAKLFDRVAEGYEKESLRLYPFCADRLLNHLRPRPGSKILEVGCGAGAVTVALAQEVRTGGGRVSAVDISEQMIKRCEASARRLGLTNIDWHEMDGVKVEFKSDYFDAVVCSYGLTYMSDMAAALKSWRRVARPGAKVLFTTLGAGAFQPFYDLLQKHVLSHGGHPANEHYRENGRATDSPEKCRTVLEAAGLERVEVVTEQVGYHVATIDDWWELVRFSDLRAWIDTLPEERYDDFRREHFAAVEELKGEDGFWLDIPTHIAWGVKP